MRPGARGDISDGAESNSDSPFAWKVEKGGSYMSTPVVYRDQIYVGDARGIVRSFDAKTGDRLFQKRLGRKAGAIASLVAGDGKIYCASENGTVYVLKHGRELEIIAENKLLSLIHI